MKQTIFLFTACIMISLSSCDDKVKAERLQRLDSLGVHLNHVNDVVNSVDSVMLKNRNAEMDRREKWLWDNIDDTLNAKPGLIIGDYFRTQKHQNKVLRRFMEVKKELKYSEAQLSSLREDVKNSFYSVEEFEGFMKTESEAVEKLVKASDELNAANENVQTRYERLLPQANEVIDSIKTVIYGDEPIDI